MSKDWTSELIVRVKIKRPRVPNYILLAPDGAGESKFRVGDLNDGQLRDIADGWRDDLFAVAEQQRQEKED